MAERYPAEWWQSRDHYTAEEVHHLERLYGITPQRPPATPGRGRRGPRPVTCQRCGVIFTAGDHARSRYCSDGCRDAAAADAPTLPPPPDRPVLKAVWTCHHCGTRFPGYTRRARRYCSPRCAHAARWTRRSKGSC